MSDSFKYKWVGGVFIAGVAAVWGVSGLVSGKLDIPYRKPGADFSDSHAVVHGWPAVCLALALVFAGVWLNGTMFWSQYPRWERPASMISRYAGFIAGTLFVISIFALTMMAIAGLTP
jgi:hypothetical protein